MELAEKNNQARKERRRRVKDRAPARRELLLQHRPSAGPTPGQEVSSLMGDSLHTSRGLVQLEAATVAGLTLPQRVSNLEMVFGSFEQVGSASRLGSLSAASNASDAPDGHAWMAYGGNHNEWYAADVWTSLQPALAQPPAPRHSVRAEATAFRPPVAPALTTTPADTVSQSLATPTDLASLPAADDGDDDCASDVGDENEKSEIENDGDDEDENDRSCPPCGDQSSFARQTL